MVTIKTRVPGSVKFEVAVSVQQAGEKMRLTATLIEVTTKEPEAQVVAELTKQECNALAAALKTWQ
jgi:hypothetical protein